MAGSGGCAGGVLRGVEPERCFLPRTIEFVAASSSTSAPSGGDASGSGVDGLGPKTTAPPRPDFFLYPRERVVAHCCLRENRPVGRGLRNAGNTCFFNSVVQVLTHTRPFQNFLLSKEHSNKCEAADKLEFCALCLLEQHVCEALDGARGAVHPRALLKRLGELGGKSMRLGRQEDAQEFLRQLLDACHRPVVRNAKERHGDVPMAVQHTTFTHQLFGGYLQSQVNCLECGFTSNTFDPFLDLSLEVKHAATLEKALDGFTRCERISGPTKFRCKRCEHQVDATKRFVIVDPPPILTFQLKRFEYCQGQRGKLVKNVSFPPSMDVARFTSRPEVEAVYRLYGVVVHKGHSARSGHYVAYARHPGGSWYMFNDDIVNAVGEQVVLRQEAYLLFYEAVVPPSGPAASQNGASAHSAVAGGAASPWGGAKLNGVLGRLAGVGRLSAVVDDAAEATAEAELCVDAPKDSASAQPTIVPNGSVGKLSRASMTSSTRTSSSAASSAGSLGRMLMHRGLRRLRKLQGAASTKRKRQDAKVHISALPTANGELSAAAIGTRIDHVTSASGDGRPDAVTGLPVCKRQRKLAAEGADDPVARGNTQTPEERDKLSRSWHTQYGLSTVDAWDDRKQTGQGYWDEKTVERRNKFKENQRILQPLLQKRDAIDMEYDVGKKKHKPKKPKDLFEGTTAFDKEQFRRKQAAKGKGKGKGKGEGKDKGKGKGKGKEKGPGREGEDYVGDHEDDEAFVPSWGAGNGKSAEAGKADCGSDHEDGGFEPSWAKGHEKNGKDGRADWGSDHEDDQEFVPTWGKGHGKNGKAGNDGKSGKTGGFQSAPNHHGFNEEEAEIEEGFGA